jgi:hypothetical protein
VGGWPPTECRDGDDAKYRGHTQSSSSRRLAGLLLHIFDTRMSLEELDGGCPGYGGGTLYMKWGAGRRGARREC